MFGIYPSLMNINLLKKIPINFNINVGNFHQGYFNILVENGKYNISYIFHMYIRNQTCLELTTMIKTVGNIIF